MIEGHEKIRAAYRDDGVARDYVARRFREPLGAMLHDRQVARMRYLARTIQPNRVLEIAPGPARITADVASSFACPGVLMDASAQMLAEAQARLASNGHRGWQLIQGDAFHLPFESAFDLVYSFRLIRHFDDRDRQRLYRSIHAVLRPRGLLVFDAVNESLGHAILERAGGTFQVYDALLTATQVRQEVEEAGFRVVHLDDVQRHYGLQHQMQVLLAPRSRRLARVCMEIIDRFPGGDPLEWIVTCARA
jgi:ubiquinone/menaquinone biosynthesis C-methylase UbiE